MKDQETVAYLNGDVDERRADWHWFWRYGLSVLVFGATIGLALLNTNYNVKLNLTIPIVLAIVLAAWYGGRGPGILLSILFQATTILYATIPPDSSAAKAWFGYFSTFALYIFLVLMISGLKRVLRRLSSQRDLLQVTLASIGDAVIATDKEGHVTFMNPVAQSLTGWRDRSFADTKLERIFSIEDEATGEKAPDPVEAVMSSRAIIDPLTTAILVSADGRRIPIDHTAAPITHGGITKGVVIVFSDATERKLAERSRRETEIMRRLVEAQEAERHRIARDLHDHLGQRMTGLRLRIEGLTEKAVSVPALGEAISEVQESALHIDRDIGFLSWELRPTELEELGLADALHTFVREWGGQYGINSQFHADRNPLPALSRHAETNLYRITQEALNNVLKHAGATNVNVLLQRRDNDLLVIVEDDGVGFAPGDGSNVAPHSGLGIIGMQERAALLGGSLEIDGESGEGTTVIARVPLTQDLQQSAF